MSEDSKRITLFYVIACFLTYALFVGIWLLFTSNLAKPEVYSGLGAAAIATVATIVFEAVGLIQFRPRLKDLLEAWRIPGYVLKGTFEMLKAMAIQLFTREGAPSMVFAVAHDATEADARSAARRALVATYISMTPSSVVLGIVREQRLMLYHQIFPSEPTRMSRNLGARP